MKNKTAIVAIAALAIIGIISGTYAYFTSQATVTNQFTATSYSTQIQRTLTDGSWLPGQSIALSGANDKLNVKNTGTTPIAVRAKINTDSFTRIGSDSRANPSSTITVGGSSQDVISKTIDTTNWIASTEEDGWYYYNGKLGSTAETSNFITNLTFNSHATNDSSCTYDALEVPNNSAAPGNTNDTGTGNVTCTSGAAGYDNTTYTLSIQFETIQYNAADTWTGIPSSVTTTLNS